MKKITFLMLIVLVLSVFSSISLAHEVNVKEPDNPVTVDWWFQDWTAGLKMTNEFADYIMDKYPNIEINILPIAREAMTEKTLPAIMSGNEPDIMMGYSNYLETLDVSKLFLGLTPEIFSKEEAESLWYKNFLKQMQGSDGHYYGLPWGTGSDGWGAVVSDELFREAGIDFEPGVLEYESWEDIKRVAKKATQYNDDGSIAVSGISFADYMQCAPIYPGFALQLGAEPFKNGEWDWTTPACKEALEEIYWFKEQEVYNPRAGGLYESFPKGIVAMAALGPWGVGAFHTDYPDMELSYVGFPPLNPDDPQYFAAAWAFTFFSKRVKNDEDKFQAIKVIANELATPKYLMSQINYWAGTPALKEFVEGINDGTLVPATEAGKTNAKIAAKLVETHLPYVADLGPTKLNSQTINNIIAQELDALFSGTQDVDETLENITDQCNEKEALK